MRTLIFLSILLSVKSFANLNNQFEGLLKNHKIPKESLSLSVLKLNQDDKWSTELAVNPKVERTPASLTKILTAIAAFETLPSNFQFVTEFKAQAIPKTSILNGPLYLVGSGDPTFVTERLWLLVHDFSRLGVKKIQGDLIYDDTIFDREIFSKSRSTENHRAYSAPASGLTFNWNSLWIRVMPTSVGQPARVYLDPPDETISVRSTAKTLNRSTNISVDRLTENKQDKIVASGHVSSSEEFSVYRSHTQPAERAAYQAMVFLKNAGIEVTGKIKSGKVPASYVQVAKTESVSIEEIIKMMMKFSNNLISEMLIKLIDHRENQRSGTLEGGLVSMKKILKKYSAADYKITNPSGLTTDNKMTVDFITELLIKMKNNPRFDAEFLSTFPRAGIDGTVKKRMTRAKGYVRAKTGLLNGVVGLAGYIHSVKGHTYAFSFIYNGDVSKQGRATDLFDRTAEAIALSY